MSGTKTFWRTPSLLALAFVMGRTAHGQSIVCCSFLFVVPQCPAICKSGGTCLPYPREYVPLTHKRIQVYIFVCPMHP